LNGLAGADAHCQALAAAVGAGGPHDRPQLVRDRRFSRTAAPPLLDSRLPRFHVGDLSRLLRHLLSSILDSGEERSSGCDPYLHARLPKPHCATTPRVRTESYAVTPKIAWINWRCATGSPLATQRTRPLRMACIASYPSIVRHAPSTAKSEARHDPLLDEPMVLLDDVVQIRCRSATTPPTRVHRSASTRRPRRRMLDHYLLHDRDAKFCTAFDDVLASEGIQALRLPWRSPNLNAFTEAGCDRSRRSASPNSSCLANVRSNEP